MIEYNEERFFNLSAKEETILFSVLYYERYGLEIIEAIKQASNNSWHLAFGSLYPTLKKLEHKGFVKHRFLKRKRKYYQITDLGKNILQKKQNFLQFVATWEHNQAETKLS